MPETQAVTSWSAPTGTLGTLVASAARRAAVLERTEARWRLRAETAPKRPSLREALLQRTVGVVAEIKRSSPSRGAINPGLDAVPQAQFYTDGGAAAISVLTEPERFGGSDEDLAGVAAAVTVPVLKKDFHVAEVQLYQARALGASAALLIVRALEPVLLRDLVDAGTGVGLECLVEIRDEYELEVALAAGALMIGVNNRNLETLVMDATTTARIIPLIPPGMVAVAESGMRDRADVESAARFGADAVLVGSAVSASTDPAGAVAELAGVISVRQGRGSRDHSA